MALMDTSNLFVPVYNCGLIGNNLRGRLALEEVWSEEGIAN